MSAITDLILKQVQAAASGSNLGNNVLNSLSDSVVSGIKQTASSANGIQQLTSLFSGNASSATINSLVNAASQAFTSTAAPKLGLSSEATNTATSLLPTIINGVVSAVTGSGSGFNASTVLSALGLSGKKASTISRLGQALGSLFRKK